MLEVLQRMGYSPRSCVWELTLTCNLRCRHCGSFAGAKRENELSLEECRDVADQLINIKCKRVTLAGGEPTLHPHWAELGGRLIQGGLQVNIISNGWHWTAKEIKMAKEVKLANVGFSLDGFQQAHDTIRRKDSFRRVVEAIERSREAGLFVAVNTTVCTNNYHDLPQLRDFLAEKGVFSWQLQFATPAGNLTKFKGLMLQPEDLLWLVPQVARIKREGGVMKVLPGDNIGYYGKFEADLRGEGKVPFWLGCRAGCQVLGIESSGNIKGCLSLPSSMHGEDRFIEGNLRQHSLAEIWNGPDAFAYNRKYSEDQLAGFCRICHFHEYCRGGCSWGAYSYTNNRFDNPYCFYRQAIKSRRFDLLEEEEISAEERTFFEQEEPPQGE